MSKQSSTGTQLLEMNKATFEYRNGIAPFGLFVDNNLTHPLRKMGLALYCPKSSKSIKFKHLLSYCLSIIQLGC